MADVGHQARMQQASTVLPALSTARYKPETVTMDKSGADDLAAFLTITAEWEANE